MNLKLGRKGIAFILILIAVGAAIGLTLAFLPKPTTQRDNIVQDRVPNPPTLNTILMTSTSGVIELNWQAEPSLSTKVFRASAEFSAASQATLIATLNDPNVQAFTYTDTVADDGMYYYGVVVSNAIGDSDLSNVVSVTVSKPPVGMATVTPPFVTITPQTSTDGTVKIAWTESPEATSYKIYRSDVFFTDVVSASLLMTLTVGQGLYITTQFLISGEFYYAVVALDDAGASAMSNVASVVVNLAAFILTPTDRVQSIDASMWYPALIYDGTLAVQPDYTITTQYTSPSAFRVKLSDDDLRIKLGITTSLYLADGTGCVFVATNGWHMAGGINLNDGICWLFKSSVKNAWYMTVQGVSPNFKDLMTAEVLKISI
jgi:hypothetical protein